MKLWKQFWPTELVINREMSLIYCEIREIKIRGPEGKQPCSRAPLSPRPGEPRFHREEFFLILWTILLFKYNIVFLLFLFKVSIFSFISEDFRLRIMFLSVPVWSLLHRFGLFILVSSFHVSGRHWLCWHRSKVVFKREVCLAYLTPGSDQFIYIYLLIYLT